MLFPIEVYPIAASYNINDSVWSPILAIAIYMPSIIILL